MNVSNILTNSLKRVDETFNKNVQKNEIEEKINVNENALMDVGIFVKNDVDISLVGNEGTVQTKVEVLTEADENLVPNSEGMDRNVSNGIGDKVVY